MTALRAAALALAVGLLCSCRSSAERALPTATELRELERLMHVHFPPSARVVHWQRENGIDEYVRLKLETAASDWPGFLARSPLSQESLDATHESVLGGDTGAWDPGAHPHVRAGQAQLSNGKVLNLGVDETGAKAVVYLVYYGT